MERELLLVIAVDLIGVGLAVWWLVRKLRSKFAEVEERHEQRRQREL